MAVRAQHMLVPDRLLRSPRLSEVVPDPAVHDVESLSDRRDLHAHGLGAPDTDLRHSAAAGGCAGIRGHHGVRGELHVLHPGVLFCDGILALQLPFWFHMRTLCDALMSPSPC